MTLTFNQRRAIVGLMTYFLFFSRPEFEGWPHHGRTFSVYLSPLSFWLTLPWRVLFTSWCCPSRPWVVFLVCVHLALSFHLKGSRCVSSFFLSVQLSQPYVAIGHVGAFIGRIFVEIGMLWLFRSDAPIACPLFNRGQWWRSYGNEFSLYASQSVECFRLRGMIVVLRHWSFYIAHCDPRPRLIPGRLWRVPPIHSIPACFVHR